MKKQRYLIMGRNCILEVLKSQPERLELIYTSKDETDELVKIATRLGIDVSYKRKESLHLIIESESHQGYVACLKAPMQPELGAFLKSLQCAERSLLIMLDGITDPQNVGAILRAGECFGVDGMILGKNNCCPITPVVAKVSVGASELLPIISVNNHLHAVELCKQEGYHVVAMEITEESIPINSHLFQNKTLLILGSEGFGIHPKLSSTADKKIYIPMHGAIDSLNVSQASAVALCYWRG